MRKNQESSRLYFKGERVKWISVEDLEDLLELKAEYPDARLVVGNTTVGKAKRCTVSICSHQSLSSVHL